jgi:hypothetical protein
MRDGDMIVTVPTGEYADLIVHADRYYQLMTILKAHIKNDRFLDTHDMMSIFDMMGEQYEAPELKDFLKEALKNE